MHVIVTSAAQAANVAAVWKHELPPALADTHIDTPRYDNTPTHTHTHTHARTHLFLRHVLAALQLRHLLRLGVRLALHLHGVLAEHVDLRRQLLALGLLLGALGLKPTRLLLLRVQHAGHAGNLLLLPGDRAVSGHNLRVLLQHVLLQCLVAVH